LTQVRHPPNCGRFPDLDPAVLSVGTGGIPDLIRGVTDLNNGRGDYSVRKQKGKPETSTELWFWWQIRDGLTDSK
jgi:hypothetical protein